MYKREFNEYIIEVLKCPLYEGFVFILTLKIGQIFTRSQKGMAMHEYDYA